MDFQIVPFWGVALYSVAFATATHIALHKRDSKSAASWIIFALVFPGVGTLLYLLLGINRVARKAEMLATRGLPIEFEITKQNSIEAYEKGSEVYASMLQAIEGAKHTVHLCTYIFDNGQVAKRLIEAMAAAQTRGVKVRILLDDVGRRYTWPSIVGSLKKAGLESRTFLPIFKPGTIHYFNLRNHRKLLIVDDELVFTGGMNVRDGHDETIKSKQSILDLHFLIRGPVCFQLAEVFLADWIFSGGEKFEISTDHASVVLGSPLHNVGKNVETNTDKNELLAKESAQTDQALDRGLPFSGRAIPDGPGKDIEKIEMLLLYALRNAKTTVDILTPYLILNASLFSSLRLAVVSGVRVRVLLPKNNNLRFVGWAMNHFIDALLGVGVEVALTPKPFDHSKLFIVDRVWATVGSANWDPRSLRLNFELNVEIAGEAACQRFSQIFEKKWHSARRLTLSSFSRRPLLNRIRDGFARLASPYL
ncbi:MAG: hypothetical protein COT74_12035 [Bdellovibrionales bacterium CG10_big_fil_rev_8_21_14_0_10_45_34]|nr:MAG: hypothetical protein COT74_12035 [Bdellovibrionales bacterium CG10_big_fil_rev_8_21_14_0_10_45_34]